MSNSNNEDAARLIGERRFRDALGLLRAHLDADSNGETHALAGAAHYGLQEYAEAAENYERALKLDPNRRTTWQEMLMQSRANAVAEVNVHVPDITYFDSDALLARPVVRDGFLPATQMDSPRRGLFGWMRYIVGNIGGAIISLAMIGVTQVLGGLTGYRDEVWTNWYRRPYFVGILTLAYMREQLNRNNLKSTYPSGSLDRLSAGGTVSTFGGQTLSYRRWKLE